MEKHRAIPQGYMTVGEVAKKMNTTVRTLQYYDKEGVLSPSAESGGGRRLYTDKDIIKLHQIQSMKYLGFSLDDIKNRLISLDNPADVAAMLAEHAANVREKIMVLTESLRAIEALKDEATQMQSVDFKKYAAIIVSLQMKNEYYGLIKHFDDKTFDGFVARFADNKEKAASVVETMTRVMDKAIQFQQDGVLPESEEGQELAEEFWDIVTESTGGDMTLLTKLAELAENTSDTTAWKIRMVKANVFFEPALAAYFTKLGINPFEQGETNND